MTKHVSAAVIATAMLASTAAQAEPGAWQVGEGYVIRYQDLDLRQPSGQQALLARVQRSAHRACAGLLLSADERACEQRAIEQSLVRADPAARRALQLALADRPQTLASR